MAEENQSENPGLVTPETASEQYSLAMVDTIFADTLSRGMQNAITSQQNAQMASASSVTNACARILQAKAKPVEGQIQPQAQASVQQRTADPQSRQEMRGTDKQPKEVKAPQNTGANPKPQTGSQETVVEVTEKMITEESQGADAIAADKQDASNKQSGSVSSNKLLLMLIASASLGAVIAGAFVSTYLSTN